MRLSIIIPAHNEEKRIGETLENYFKFFDKTSKTNNFEYELIVVLSGCNDKTGQVAESYRNPSLRIIDVKKKGKGLAVKEGFKDALERDNDLIGFVDADMATFPEDFFDLFKHIGSADGMIANRYDSRSKIYPSFSFRRIVVGRGFNFLVRCLFLLPYEDTQCGAKVFKAHALKKVIHSIGMTQWAFDVELLYLCHKNDLFIKEIPTKWRAIGESKIKVLRSSIQMFLSIIQLRIIKSPLKRLLKPLSPIVMILWKISKG
jgi:glycosyltransferase involved in cell wall biosynthesis